MYAKENKALQHNSGSGIKYSMNRLCIFAHFDQDNAVDDYVFSYLESLGQVCTKIVFVTTSVLAEIASARLGQYCDLIITRENRGYDFASWQVGIKKESLLDYDEILLCNDSVYGPLFPLEEAFKSMSEKDCDFWGMTESNQISYHLQSYFLVFRKSVLLSLVFQTFWKNVAIQASKMTIIRTYEVGLSKVLLEAGFKAGVYATYRPSFLKRLASITRSSIIRLSKTRPEGIFGLLIAAARRIGSKIKDQLFEEPLRRRWLFIPLGTFRIIRAALKKKEHNVTHMFWKELIVSRRMPFLKVELLRDNPMNVKINNFERVLTSHSDYDVGCIKAHLKRMKKTKTGIADNRHK
jgi:lipopolysaccharide biosynthesis protein